MICASRAATVVLIVATGLIASCTRYVDDARAVSSDDQSTTASECEAVDAPLTTIPSRNRDEPVMKIPQPQEWNRSTKMDSELIRFAMVNHGPGEDGAVASAVVTLEKPPGVEEADVIFEMERHALETMAGATDRQITEHTLCGLPAETVHYRTPERTDPHPATVVMAVIHVEDSTYAATLTVGSDVPDDPTFQRDADMILKGFQLLPPPG